MNNKNLCDTSVQMYDTDSTIIEYICFVNEGKTEKLFNKYIK